MSAGTAVKAAAGAAAMLLLLIAACSSVYAVDEKEYALSLRFGEVNAVRTDRCSSARRCATRPPLWSG